MLSILNPASSISVLTRITNISSRSNLYGHIISVYRTCAVFDPADPCSFLFTLHSRELGSIPIRKCSICGIFVGFFCHAFAWFVCPSSSFYLWPNLAKLCPCSCHKPPAWNPRLLPSAPLLAMHTPNSYTCRRCWISDFLHIRPSSPEHPSGSGSLAQSQLFTGLKNWF